MICRNSFKRVSVRGTEKSTSSLWVTCEKLENLANNFKLRIFASITMSNWRFLASIAIAQVNQDIQVIFGCQCRIGSHGVNLIRIPPWGWSARNVGYLWSCLATIFACSWVSIHPNIPAPWYESWWRIFLRHGRLELMFWAVVGCRNW